MTMMMMMMRKDRRDSAIGCGQCPGQKGCLRSHAPSRISPGNTLAADWLKH